MNTQAMAGDCLVCGKPMEWWQRRLPGPHHALCDPLPVERLDAEHVIVPDTAGGLW